MQTQNSIPHIPVLLEEVLEAFSDLETGTFVDCTMGFGGHSEAIAKNHPDLTMICIDRDRDAHAFAQKRLEPYQERITFLHGSYAEQFPTIENNDVTGVLADIGVSSWQLDARERGFGFDSDSLDMRMNQESPLSAKEVVNQYSLEELQRIFRDYGEVREYKKAARIICEARKEKKFESNRELAALIERHFYKAKIHPATLIFQAIRIEVNQELKELENLLDTLEERNYNNAIIAIITFHSLEDRIVKNRFKAWTQSCICPPEAFKCSCGNNHDKGKIMTRKPLSASAGELKTNTRARSAKMRVFRFHGE